VAYPANIPSKQQEHRFDHILNCVLLENEAEVKSLGNQYFTDRYSINLERCSVLFNFNAWLVFFMFGFKYMFLIFS
jgi:hypothetical protein